MQSDNTVSLQGNGKKSEMLASIGLEACMSRLLAVKGKDLWGFVLFHFVFLLHRKS